MNEIKEDLVDSKAKLEWMSSLKPIIELESKYALIKPKDDNVYVPFFKRNHNKERANFSRIYKGKRTLNESHVKKPMSRSYPKH